jgi:hypothetical protein
MDREFDEHDPRSYQRDKDSVTCSSSTAIPSSPLKAGVTTVVGACGASTNNTAKRHCAPDTTMSSHWQVHELRFLPEHTNCAAGLLAGCCCAGTLFLRLLSNAENSCRFGRAAVNFDGSFDPVRPAFTGMPYGRRPNKRYLAHGLHCATYLTILQSPFPNISTRHARFLWGKPIGAELHERSSSLKETRSVR